jgi:hypothetical protein
MGLFKHLTRLSGQEIIRRWGSGAVLEAYESEFGSYRISLLKNERLDVWTASCSRRVSPMLPPFHVSVDEHTKRRAVQSLERLLKEHFQNIRELSLRELDCLDSIEATFGQTRNKSALERLAG